MELFTSTVEASEIVRVSSTVVYVVKVVKSVFNWVLSSVAVAVTVAAVSV